MLFKPTVERLEDDALYHNERLLLEAEAKACHALTLADQHKVTCERLTERIAMLKMRISSRQVPSHV